MTLEATTVLFLCSGNSARSILAEAILKRDGGRRFEAHSAGSRPKGEINPVALAVLRSLDHETGDLRSKSWDAFAAPGAPALDFVFTLCDSAAEEVCPIWPAQPMTTRPMTTRPMTTHWGLADPAAVEGGAAVKHAAVLEAYRILAKRIGVFVNLPLDSFDTPSLKARLEEIGRDQGAPVELDA